MTRIIDIGVDRICHRRIDRTKRQPRSLTLLTLARGRVTAPKTARYARSDFRSNQHVSVRAHVFHRGAYRSLGAHDRGVLRFLGAAAGRRFCK